MSAPILDIYMRDAAYFQRLLDFLLISRFRSVRLNIVGYDSECVFISTEGEIIDFHNKKTRYATLTEWFNTVCKTKHDVSYIGMFAKIMATRRVNLMQILMTVKDDEIRNFKDVRHHACMIYGFLTRRMQACGLETDWENKPMIPVIWKEATYYVTYQGIETTEGDLDEFMRVLTGKETDITDLYTLRGGVRILLTHQPALLPTPAEDRLLKHQDFLQGLYDAEIADLKRTVQELSGHVVSLLEGQKVLHGQYNNVLMALRSLVPVHGQPLAQQLVPPPMYPPPPPYYR